MTLIRQLTDIFALIGAVALLLVRCSARIATLRVNPALLIRQMALLGVDTIPIAALVQSFVGASLSYVMARELAERGAQLLLPGSILLIELRELLPVLTAVVFAGKVGASITAEIGAMRVTEQIDALRTLHVDPDWYLTIPRLLAALIMMPVVAVFAGYAGYYSAWFMAKAQIGMSLSTFVQYSGLFVDVWDYYASLIKLLVFASTVTLVAVVYGYRSTGGAAGVGRAVTASVTTSIVLIFALDLILLPVLF